MGYLWENEDLLRFHIDRQYFLSHFMDIKFNVRGPRLGEKKLGDRHD